MKWPLVSRESYKLVLALLGDTRADLVAANERTDELIQTLTQLRRYGFDPERPVPTDLTALPELDDLDNVIQDAIEEIALPGESLHRDLVRQAYRELQTTEDPEEVAKVISAGADIEDL